MLLDVNNWGCCLVFRLCAIDLTFIHAAIQQLSADENTMKSCNFRIYQNKK